MRLNLGSPPWELCGQKPPKKWFAWHPVWTEDGHIVWLEHVWLSRYVTVIGDLRKYAKGLSALYTDR